jgi:hypothetical protein
MIAAMKKGDFLTVNEEIKIIISLPTAHIKHLNEWKKRVN